jgi:hypothetical protein
MKPLAWLFLIGIAVAVWGWSAALAPRRLRAPLPPSIEVLTPPAAIENPRVEAALALAAAFCFVGRRPAAVRGDLPELRSPSTSPVHGKA